MPLAGRKQLRGTAAGDVRELRLDEILQHTKRNQKAAGEYRFGAGRCGWCQMSRFIKA